MNQSFHSILSLVTFSYVLHRRINFVSTGVSLCLSCLRRLADDAVLFVKDRTAVLKLYCLY